MANTAETIKGAAGVNTIVAPFYSTLDAIGAASVDVLEEQTVSMAYDEKYMIDLEDASSCKILNAFILSGDGASLSVGMRSEADQNFKDVIKNVIDHAKNASGNSAQTVLYNDAIDTFKSVYGDKIANLLQSDWNLSVKIQSTTGAVNVYEDFAHGTAASNRLLLAQQIPNSDYMAYKDLSENSLTDALPLTVGDQLVFLFNLSSTLTTRSVADVKTGTSATQSSSESQGPQQSGSAASSSMPTVTGTGAASGNTATATNAAAAAVERGGNTAPGLATSHTSAAKLVAFYVTLKSGSRAVGSKFNGISAVLPLNQNPIGEGQTGALGDSSLVVPKQSGVDTGANE